MSRLGIADVQVVVEEHGATYRRYGDRAVLHAQLVDGLGQVLVDQPVTAAGAVVSGVALQPLTVGVPLESFVEDAAHVIPPQRR